MDHATAKKNLSAYLDGAVTPEEKVLLEEHLEACPECRAELRDLAETVSRLRSLGEVEPPPWLAVKVMARVRQEAGLEKGLFLRLFAPFGWKLCLAAALVFLTVTGYLIYRSAFPGAGSVVPAGRQSREEGAGRAPPEAVPRKPVTGGESAGRPSAKGRVPPAAGRETVKTPPAAEPSRLPLAGETAPFPATPPQAAPRATQEMMEGSSKGVLEGGGSEPRMEQEKAVSSAASRATPLAPVPTERIRRQLAVDDLAAAIRNIKSAARRSGGTADVIGTGDAEGTMVVRVDRERRGELLERLPAIGEVLDSARLPTGEEAVLHVVIEVYEGSVQERQ